MGILVEIVRVKGFRGLKNIEVCLEKTTILTGMNNAGKTSFLKALQLALGSRQFITQDDFYIQGNALSKEIIIDLLIVPVNDKDNRCDDFSDSWVELFTTDRIKVDGSGKSFVPLRTVIAFDELKNNFKVQQYILQEWPSFIRGTTNWFDTDNGNKTGFHFDELPFFYMDAQRDILEDTKLRSSYLGRMLSKIEYSPKLIKEIEDQIKKLNEKAVKSSDVLLNIRKTLEGLDTAMDAGVNGIEVTPFTKKIRDLSKGLSIYYTDREDSFPMECHGMGTRSWSSLLTLKAFISLLSLNASNDNSVFFPILTIEEPESHLHPNAQKKLYNQLDNIVGQKIISTHSPYIAAVARLHQIRNFYKMGTVKCGQLDMLNLNDEDIRKINRQVINTRGEIFFSKVIVFVEGETEEQSLPILSKKHFNKSNVEMGIDFIGVGGFGNYLPFIRFAEALNIPWIIFSDAENTAEKAVKKSVQDQFTKSGTSKLESNSIVFLKDGKDFEGQLIEEGYTDEIKEALKSVCQFENEHHKTAKEKEISDYTNDQLYKKLTDNKAQFGPVVAEMICASSKDLPSKLVELFKMIEDIIQIRGTK